MKAYKQNYNNVMESRYADNV